MIVEERQTRIMEILNQRQFVSVNELVLQLQASRSSIVRDLITLEKKGALIRQRGGASLKTGSAILNEWTEQSVFEKEKIHMEQKQAICKEAARFIRDGQCIYIDSGTTASYLLPYVEHKPVTLVTPSIYLLRKLSDRFQGDLFLIGGKYAGKYDMSIGALSEQMIRQFRFDVSFFTANGIDIKEKEVYSGDFGLGNIKSIVMERSKQKVLLADSSKFEITAICCWSKTDDFDAIVTDAYPQKRYPKNVRITGKDKK